jgi:hypothetical protein
MDIPPPVYQYLGTGIRVTPIIGCDSSFQMISKIVAIIALSTSNWDTFITKAD